jgi:regulator of RNase E activity RraA
MPDDFPVLAGSIGPSHGFVHVRDIGTPVTVFGMSVADGDLIHADRHGAVAIPPEALPKLSDALDVLFSSEEIVLGPIRDGTVTLAEFEALWAAFEKARI